jgi:hypothetical protein
MVTANAIVMYYRRMLSLHTTSVVAKALSSTTTRTAMHPSLDVWRACSAELNFLRPSHPQKDWYECCAVEGDEERLPISRKVCAYARLKSSSDGR